jgi:peptidoglycan hydrolase CwlO-like protein
LHSKEVKGFNEFQKLVLEVTQEFKRISLCIIELEKRLRTKLEAERLADLVRSLQDQEKEKLHLTAQLQMKLKEAQDSPNRSESLDDEICKIKVSLRRLVGDINECLEDIKYEIES